MWRGYHYTALIKENRTAPSTRHCQGTPLRNEIESRDVSLLKHVTE
jgi:hypothetical protein